MIVFQFPCGSLPCTDGGGSARARTAPASQGAQPHPQGEIYESAIPNPPLKFFPTQKIKS